MKIGAMNNPRNDLVAEIRAIASKGFDFIDLTLEHPRAHVDVINRKEVLSALRESGLSDVGHTTYYLPFACPINAVREAAIHDVMECFDIFKQAGAQIVTVHPDPGVGTIETKATISLNALCFKIVSDEASKHGLTVVVENVPGVFSSLEGIKAILEFAPALGFHLDVGHAFVGRNRFRQLLSMLSGKMMHVHLSDNRMHHDDHVPLGAGNINWADVIPAIKKTGYDSTFTLEVFANDHRYLAASKEKFIEIWNSC